jgi:hypothetical protein
MFVEVVKQNFRDSRGYKVLHKDWCCEELKNNPTIDLYDEYFDDEIDLPQMAIHEAVTEYSYEDEFTEDYFYPIKFCPFCGKAIRIIVAKEEDVTEEFNRLVEQREALYKKYINIRGIKKRIELRDKLDGLDMDINYFYNLCDYKEGASGKDEEDQEKE